MKDQDRIKKLEQENEALKAQLAANKEQPDTSANAVSPSVPLFKIIIFAVLLLLLGLAIYYCYKGYIIQVLTYLNVFIFGLGVLLVFVFLFSKETFLWLIGKKTEYHNILKAGQSLTTGAVGTALKYAPIELSDKEKEKVKKDVPALVEMGLMTGINNYIIRFFVGAFAASFALLGTITLMNQNQKIDKQNKRLDQQTYLQEAERRSSLVFLFSNIMDAVDKELKEDYNDDDIRNLSPQLIGRITGLSTRLKPYHYLDGDTLTAKPLSPERGQLLVSLLGSQLDEKTMDEIYSNSNFKYSDLKNAYLGSAYLRKVNLRKADLRYAYLNGACLNGAYLNEVDLRYANLRYANLRFGWLEYANLGYANLESVNLRGAGLWSADLRSSNLANAVLSETKLKEANLKEADLTGAYLKEADLTGAYLKGGNLTNTSLRKASMIDVNLKGVNLKGADLTSAQIKRDFFRTIQQYQNEDTVTNTHYILENYQIDSTFENNEWIYRLKRKENQ